MNELDLRSMGFMEAWNTFKTEIEMDSHEYKRARFGIKIKFDINDYLKGRITIKAKSGKAFIRGTAHKLENFETELELREREIKNWLIDNFSEDEIATPRGIDYDQQ